MSRMPTYTALLLAVLSMRGERLEASYPEGLELVHAERDSFGLRIDQVTHSSSVEAFLEGVEFPRPSALEERSIRYCDTVLAVSEGRPTRVRREFEELRKHTMEDDEERDEIGPLEGRSLLASEGDGEATAELQDDGDDVNEVYLADHPVRRYADYLLPDDPVELGERWELREEHLRRLTGIGPSPVYFESDLSDLEEHLYGDGEDCTVRGEAEFAAIVERDGLRCALVAFEIELETDVDHPQFRVSGKDVAGVTAGTMQFQLGYAGKMWYALAEGRPVAMQMHLDGTLDMRIVFDLGGELEFRMKGSATGESFSTWKSPE